MPQMINIGKEMLRISPKDTRHLEYSTNQGRTWSMRYIGSIPGEFIDLMDAGNEIIATTQKGLYYSTNQGRTWCLRRHN